MKGLDQNNTLSAAMNAAAQRSDHPRDSQDEAARNSLARAIQEIFTAAAETEEENREREAAREQEAKGGIASHKVSRNGQPHRSRRVHRDIRQKQKLVEDTIIGTGMGTTNMAGTTDAPQEQKWTPTDRRRYVRPPPALSSPKT